MKLRLLSTSLLLSVGLLVAPVAALAVGETPVLSQSSITVGLNQAASVSLQGALNSVYVFTNTNPSIASLSISGSQITVTGSQVGSTSVALCYNGATSNCATLAITVQSGGTTASSVTFDNANPVVAPAGTISVTIMSGGTAFYVSANTNPSIMSYQLNNNSMSISGISAGTAQVTICSAISTTSCGQLNVTVGTGSAASNSTTTTTTNQAVGFNPSNPSVAVGQTINVTLSGAVNYFVSVNTNPIAVQTSVSGGILMITGSAAGSTTLTVCVAGTSNCATLPVVVTATATTPTPAPVAPTPAPVAAPTYAPTPVSTASNSSASLSLTIQLMQAQLSQMLLAIQSMQAQLKQLLATTSVGGVVNTNASLVTVSTPAFTGKFVSFLDLNSTGAEVTALQKKLTEGGYYSGPITGTFGPLTSAAVKKFQEANGLDPAGYVGPSTRAVLNQ